MFKATGSGSARPGPWLVVALAVVLVLAAAACGKDDGSASTPTTKAPATTVASGEPGTTVVHGGPRWETVTTFTGTGPTDTAPFKILPDSIQWRARWKCDTGQLKITTDPPPRKPAALVDAACPGKGEGFAIVSGDVHLKVEASGPWEVIVDQQVDTPLKEPPFEGMATAPVLRHGSFYDVEKSAKGSAQVFQRSDGTRVLRLQDFEVSTNVDLFVWLSEAPAPKTSADAVAAPHVVLGNLKSTVGDQNYVLPAAVSTDQVKSIVIWCEPVRIVYGAAALA